MGSVYHKFRENDLLHTVVHTRPHASFVSGTGGWRGNFGVSSSLSLYGGIRARTDLTASNSSIKIYPLDLCDTHSIDKVIFVSGSYPSTGSVKMVKCRNTSVQLLGDITDTDWYEEHFSPIELLYDYHSRYNDNFFTGSYDFYCLRLLSASKDANSAVVFPGDALYTADTNITVEARIKPTTITGSRDYVIASQDDNWRFYITGTNGTLTFHDLITIVTSSVTLTNGKWQHVAVSYNNTNNVVKFYKDGVLTDSKHVTQIIAATTKSLVIGAEREITTNANENYGFNGFIYETRVWDTTKTDAQISSSYNSVIISSHSLDDLVHYARFNDGALASSHGYAIGSGVFDHSGFDMHGQLININAALPLTPVWHVNDDNQFSTLKTKILNGANFFKIIHVPSMFYGRQISTGSVRLECRAYENQGITRVLIDDGKGSLYISGSITNELVSDERSSVKWNKVGNVFYTEGLIVINEPTLFDFGDINRDGLSDTLSVEFEGDNRIPSKVFMCRMGPTDCNASNNPTYSRLETFGTEDTADDRYVRTGDAVTYITAIGIYNEDRKLVAVAKLARPLRKREQDKFNIKIALDF